MGVFRKRWEAYYQQKRKLPTIEQSTPDIGFVGVSKNHPSKNISLRNSTFREIDYRYYQLKPTLPVSKVADIFGPLISKIHPSRNVRLRDSTFDTEPLNRYQSRRVLPPSQFVPGITVLISKVHPARDIRLRDATFREPSRIYYRPKHLHLNVEEFVGVFERPAFKGMFRGMYRGMQGDIL